MPIEIRELVIRAHIDDSAPRRAETGREGREEKEEWIADCLDQAARLRRDEKER